MAGSIGEGFSQVPVPQEHAMPPQASDAIHKISHIADMSKQEFQAASDIKKILETVYSSLVNGKLEIPPDAARKFSRQLDIIESRIEDSTALLESEKRPMINTGSLSSHKEYTFYDTSK